jgi:hypothetical protein
MPVETAVAGPTSPGNGLPESLVHLFAVDSLVGLSVGAQVMCDSVGVTTLIR